MRTTDSNDGTDSTNDSHLPGDERAVSPVIATVLMVALAVILAASIGVFLLDTGGEQRTVPETRFEFDYTGSNLTIEHFAGATIDGKNTFEVKVLLDGSPDGNSPWFEGGDDPLTSGDSYAVADTARLTSGTEVEVVWIGPEGERSQTLESWEVP